MLLEDLIDLLLVQALVPCFQECGSRRGVRCGKRGTAVNKRGGQAAFVRHKDVHARQSEVDHRAVVRQKTEGVIFVDGGNRDHVVLVGRIAQRRVAVLVARRNDHHHTAGYRLGNGVIQRVISMVFIITAQAQIDDVCAVIERVINRSGGIRHFAVAFFIHDLKGHDLDVRGCAVGDHAAHLGSVILRVAVIAGIIDEIVAVDIATLKVSVSCIQSCIQNGNNDLGQFFSAFLELFLKNV